LETRLLVIVDDPVDLLTVGDVARTALDDTTLVIWLDPTGSVAMSALEDLAEELALADEPDILVVLDERTPSNVESLLRQVNAVVNPSPWWHAIVAAFDRPVIQLDAACHQLAVSPT
jgi:hypothetical protein